MGSKPYPGKTEKRGAELGPGLSDKWRRSAEIATRPGNQGNGQNKSALVALNSL